MCSLCGRFAAESCCGRLRPVVDGQRNAVAAVIAGLVALGYRDGQIGEGLGMPRRRVQAIRAAYRIRAVAWGRPRSTPGGQSPPGG